MELVCPFVGGQLYRAQGLLACSLSEASINNGKTLTFSPMKAWTPVTRRRVVCAANSQDKRSISSNARIREEVIAPFRSVRMFFYLAFIASGSIGGLIALTRLIAALGKAPNADPVMEVFKGFSIDVIAVLVFALLYRSDAKAKDIQIAKLMREETLASLKVELSNKRVVTLEQLRGTVRLVIVAGPAAYVEEALKLSEAFKNDLLERGVLVVAYTTDGMQLEGIEQAMTSEDTSGRRWLATPVLTSDWSRWLMEQKKLANVPDDKPVYLSLRLDGRVRGSGIGLPPWNAFVAQLPPLKGIWGGALDGMDGKI